MHFESWSAFWDMGGYALYVWIAFGVSCLALALILIDSIVAKRHLLNLILKEVTRKKRISDANKSNAANGKSNILATNLKSGESQ